MKGNYNSGLYNIRTKDYDQPNNSENGGCGKENKKEEYIKCVVSKSHNIAKLGNEKLISPFHFVLNEP